MNRFLTVLLAFVFLVAVAIPSFADAVQVDFLLGSFLDNNAAQLAGGYVYTYAAGTTTPKATYLDSAKTQTAANPVVLDVYGRANVYADGLYKFIIKDADGVTLATYDNLEFVSAVNPTSIVTTDLTVSSMTATLVDIKAGTAASMTVDSSLITNSRLSNAAILAAPTLASHPVNLSFLNATVTAAINQADSALSAHVASATNPHGTTLTQTNLIPTQIQATSSIASGGYSTPESDGWSFFGNPSETYLNFARYLFGAEQDPTFRLKADHAANTFSLIFGLATPTVVYNANFNEVDFNGATLLDYTPPANFVVDTATGAVLIPAFGGGSVTIASYTLSGISSAAYVVNWGAEIYHSATNAATIEYSLNVNGASVQTRRTSVADDPNFMVDPEWTYQGPLKTGDYITITLSCYSSVAAGAHGTYCGRYYIQGHVR